MALLQACPLSFLVGFLNSTQYGQ
ncbi:hypothetical protein CCACVL1_01844, partial [Corchorus capsularis]